MFDLVERIRQTSIRFHRDEDRLARRELEQILDGMSTSETVRIVRAFSYFSHLANIAEDQNNIRQMRARPKGGGSGVLAETLAKAKARGIGDRPAAQLLQDGPGQPGPDRTPDRGPPQEHHGSRDGGRSPARSPRAGRADGGRGHRQRRAAPPRGADAVADQSVAPDQAHRARRGRQRPVVLRLHLPARGAAAGQCAGGSAGGGRRAGRQRARLVPAHGKLDRRRPRRQSLRHRRRHARHAAAAVEPGDAVLSERAARARLGAVDRGASRRRLRGAAHARGALARHLAAPERRALSPRGLRHLCAPDGHGRKARGRDHPPAGRQGRAL